MGLCPVCRFTHDLTLVLCLCHLCLWLDAPRLGLKRKKNVAHISFASRMEDAAAHPFPISWPSAAVLSSERQKKFSLASETPDIGVRRWGNERGVGREGGINLGPDLHEAKTREKSNGRHFNLECRISAFIFRAFAT